ncbi:glycoside hydrolase family 2 protein [Cohnella hashimotonis]|uniref:beta-mannosidase n=1 Tax=Cohnella hashimotonis TaxID=2826895 RepID=A0ABT6TMN9_9BACL|nr:glycoside hydrolase family 2 TIM barrel-domain containing protein [Cohnella hashimotonis]MDI4648005.1 glycoside hydrolase family 2 TIM barrel-domain containing protein [Cohnella hashimotonis]
MRIDLTENWELTGSYPGFWAFGRSMEVGVQLKGIVPWIPAEVPGSVHWDLHRAGYLPDPYYGANAPACEWVNQRDWLYRTSFTSEASWKGKRIALVLEGVDHSAQVLLNGERIGSHTGMFVPGQFDLSASLRYGERNTLVVVVERSPDGVAQLGYTQQVDHLKSRFGYRWDFCPRLVHIGLWKGVSLQISEWSRFDNVRVKAVPGADGSGEATVSAAIDSVRSGRFRLTAELYEPGGRIAGAASYEGEAVPGLQTVRQRITVPDARLWWPNGYGEQPLYRLNLRLEVDDSEGGYCSSDDHECHIGFRTLSFRANPGAPSDALAFTVAVNGEPIYIKGWNWVPADQLYGRDREDQVRHLIALSKRANVNMLRVWGGGLIEKDFFYRLCDEAGILVWQEMMQSSSGFNNEPSASPAFLHTVSHTMRQVIRDKRNHPSLTIWCGGNELTEGGHLDSQMVPLTDRQTNLRLLRDLVSDLDETRLYLPTSPTGPTFFLEEAHAGKDKMYDVHGPWKYAGETGHYRLYNRSDALLHSEYGGDGFASIESIARFMPAHRMEAGHAGSVEWLLHGYEYWNMDDQLQSLFGSNFGTFERMVMASQWLQAEGIRYAVEANRRRAPHCSGSLLWQLNEPYPNVSCTSAIDYYGNPKLAYSWVAKANRNLHVSLQYDGISYRPGDTFRGSIYVTADGRKADDLTVAWAARDEKGGILSEGSYSLRNMTNPTAFAGTVEFQIPRAAAVFVTLGAIGAADRRALADNEYAFAVKERDEEPPLQAFLSLPATSLEWETKEEDGGTTVAVRNTGETVALWVRISGTTPEDGGNHPVVRPLEDGFLIFPGETVRRRFADILPQDRRWSVKAMNTPTE